MDKNRLAWSQYTVNELRKLSEEDFIDLLRSVWGAGNVIGRLGIGTERTPDFTKWGPNFMSEALMSASKGAEITPAYPCHRINRSTFEPTNFDRITANPKELAGWLDLDTMGYILGVSCCVGDSDEEECPHKMECIEAWLKQPANANKC